MKIRIGTRKSRLALIQTDLVRQRIEAAFPEAEIEIVEMSTKGDELLDRSLTSFGGKGVFTRELEEALLREEIDLAVHSAKDMPMEFRRAWGSAPCFPGRTQGMCWLQETGRPPQSLRRAALWEPAPCAGSCR